MKDAFHNDLKVGDRVIYSVKGGGGTEYVVGTVEETRPCQPTNKSYYPPDRVAIKPVKTTKRLANSKSPILLYASNVVVIAALAEECSPEDTSPGDCSDL